MEYIYTSSSPEDTIIFANHLADHLQKGDILVLSGELGSGKTKFTEGILSHFDLQDAISSPTFTIVNEYITPQFPIYHFDVYRLSDVSEFYEIGGEEYFENSVCLIEWGEKIEQALPNNYIKICFEKDLNAENTRILKIKTSQNYATYFDNIATKLK